MPTAPTTTSGVLPSLLDLLAPSSTTSAGKSGQGFDALLQTLPMRTQAGRPPLPEDSRSDAPVVDPQRVLPPDEAPRITAGQRGDEESGHYEPAPREADAVADDRSEQHAATAAEQAALQESAASEDDQVVAESLAGMAMCVLPVPTPDAKEGGEEARAALREQTESERPNRHRNRVGKQPGESIAAAARANPALAEIPAVERAEQTAQPANLAAIGGNGSQADIADDKAAKQDQPPQPSAANTGAEMVEAAADRPPGQSVELASEGQATQAQSEELELAAARIDQPPDAATDIHTSNAGDALTAVDTATTNNVTPPAVAAVTQIGAAARESARSSNPSAATTGVTQTGTARRPRLGAEMLVTDGGRAARNSASYLDAPRLLTRVARAFAAAQQRDGEIQLRLSPPELGSLKLTLQMQDVGLVARVETETSAAKTAILDNLPALRERLAEQGVRIERFDVDLMQRQPGGMPDRPGDQQREAPLAPRPEPTARPRIDSLQAPRGVLSANSSPTGLNVIV